MAIHNALRINALLTTLLLLARPAAGATYYTVTDLGNLSGPLGAAANISGNGFVAGLSTLASGNYHAVLWNGGAVDLGTLGVDTQSSAFAVNDAGQVVGVSYNYGDLSPHAFRWQSGVLSQLGTFSPHDINNAGAIAGHTTVFNSANLWVDHPIVYAGGNLTELALLGGYSGNAMAINTTGMIAGQANLADNKTVRACVWINGTPHDLSTLAGTATAASAAADLNDNGQVVGWSDTASGQPHACLFQIDANGTVLSRTDLGILGTAHSYAYGLNNSGTVVGLSDYRGFVWQSGVMTDLNSLIANSSGWTITRASAINDSGVIVGEALRYGFGRAVMLTPAACLKADVNVDGSVDGRDISDFLKVMMNGGTAQQICAGDVGPSADGMVTPADIDAFVQCILNGGCG